MLHAAPLPLFSVTSGIFSTLTGKLGLPVITETDHEIVIFIVTSAVFAALPSKQLHPPTGAAPRCKSLLLCPSVAQ